MDTQTVSTFFIRENCKCTKSLYLFSNYINNSMAPGIMSVNWVDSFGLYKVLYRILKPEV